MSKDTFKIEGLNTIDFSASPYALTHNSRPKGMGRPLTKQQVLSELSKLPHEIRGHALKYGMSRIEFPFDINVGTTGTGSDMEDALHDLIETLEDAKLYIATKRARGTRAVVHYKKDGAVADSYKTLYCAILDEESARQVLGAQQKSNQMTGIALTLYCEKLWRPSAAIPLGPNEIYCPSFEEDGDANGTADNWSLIGAPTDTMETTIVLHGGKSQKLVTDASSGQGVQSATFSDAAATSCIAYAWIYRSAGDDIAVEIYDETATTVRATALLDTGGWPTETAKDDSSVFEQVYVSATGLTAGNNHRLRVQRRSGDAAQATTFYVDKAFWKWGTTTKPDEWCDHWLIYNHYDTTEGATHEGHINYFDVDDLKGDVDARLLMRVEFEQAADVSTVQDLIVGRRTRSDYASFLWWLEAEDATVQTTWADAGGLARCSAGECVSNAASATGEIQWTLSIPTTANQGRFDVYGVLSASDSANTSYRLSYDESLWTSRIYNKWVKQTYDGAWQMVLLGELNLGSFLRDGINSPQFRIYLEYAKDAPDTVQADLIWIVPKDELQMRLDCTRQPTVQVDEFWAIGRDEDFEYMGHEISTFQLGRLCRRGEAMTLLPAIENRLYLSCITDDTTHDEWEAHGTSTDLEMIVNVQYLPQYVSPLE